MVGSYCCCWLHHLWSSKMSWMDRWNQLLGCRRLSKERTKFASKILQRPAHHSDIWDTATNNSRALKSMPFCSKIGSLAYKQTHHGLLTNTNGTTPIHTSNTSRLLQMNLMWIWCEWSRQVAFRHFLKLIVFIHKCMYTKLWRFATTSQTSFSLNIFWAVAMRWQMRWMMMHDELTDAMNEAILCN